MNNLSRFLSEIAWGLDEQAGALTDDGEAAIAVTSSALRDWATQMRAVAQATQPDGAVAWAGIDGEVGVELEPEPESLIRIVIPAREVEELTQDVEAEPAAARSRAAAWAPAIERSTRDLCFRQLLWAMESDIPERPMHRPTYKAKGGE